MSDSVSLGDARVIGHTEKALQVLLLDSDPDSPRWIPRSVVHDDSEVYEFGHEGDLVVKTWWAEKEGLS